MEAPPSQPETSPEVLHESYFAANISDRETADDRLGFAPYVRAMAAFLTHPQTQGPLTVSIEGEWGSGKSSFMRQLKQEIPEAAQERVEDDETLPEAAAEPIVVDFNAWRNDGAEALWAAFALTVSDQLAKRLGWLRRQGSNFRLAWERYRWRDGWLPLLRAVLLTATVLGGPLLLLVIYGPAAVSDLLSWMTEGTRPPFQEVLAKVGIGVVGVGAYVLLFVELVRRFVVAFGNPLKFDLQKHLDRPDYASRVAFVDNFHQDFKRILDAYAGERRVYVLIDDLDRCDVPTAAELVRALNLMIPDDPRLIFVIGMDREKIAAGLAVKFKDLVPYLGSSEVTDERQKGIRFGYSFLEKFVQVPFQVPRPSAQTLHGFIDSLSEELDERSGDREARSPAEYRRIIQFDQERDSPTVKEIVRAVAPTVDYNPRRLKQFLNLFRLRISTAAATGLFYTPEAEESALTLEQLGKFVMISQRWPLLLEAARGDEEIWSELHDAVFKATTFSASNRVERWARDDRLLKLLRAFVPNHANGGYETDHIWSTARIKFSRLVEVSPPVQTLEPSSLEVKTQFGSGSVEVAEDAGGQTGSAHNKMPTWRDDVQVSLKDAPPPTSSETAS